MKLSLVKTIYEKEMLDTLRDRRTLVSMILIPLLVFPVLMLGFGSLMKAKVESTEKELQRVALIGEEYAPQLVSLLKTRNVFEFVKEKDHITAIKQKKIDLGLQFSQNFEDRIAQEDCVQITVYLDEAEFSSRAALGKLNNLLDAYQDSIVAFRLESRRLDTDLLKPVFVVHENLASKEKMGGFVLGMLLPLLIVVLTLNGAMYPAIDLTAGEKERGTLETILSSPASHFEITAGKFLAVLTASVITALLSVVSMGVTFGLGFSQMSETSGQIQIAIQPLSVALVLLMILPVACLFSSLLLSIALFAKSFKEAQNYITPLMIVVILPAMVSQIPGFELDTITAVVPIVNVSLGVKDILMSNFKWVQIGLIFLSNAIYACLSLFVTKKLFDKEEVLFRT